jgi:hypothetical protein
MKGMIFGGCSFTWGQGLWFYSDLENMYYPETPFNFDISKINDAELNFKNSLRYSRLVANYFGGFDIQKLGNGGSEDTTFQFIDQLFTGSSRTDISIERFEPNDIDYIIVQTSQVYRNRFHFELDGEEQFAIIWTSGNGYNLDNFLKWIKLNNLTFDQWLEVHIKSQVDRLRDKFLSYEQLGIKTLLLCWENDYIKDIENDPFLRDRFVTLHYNGVEYKTIFDLMQKNLHLEIKNDYANFTNPPLDLHPSKECHEVIAQSIINFIKDNHEIKETILPRETPKIKERIIGNSSSNDFVDKSESGLYYTKKNKII